MLDRLPEWHLCETILFHLIYFGWFRSHEIYFDIAVATDFQFCPAGCSSQPGISISNRFEYTFISFQCIFDLCYSYNVTIDHHKREKIRMVTFSNFINFFVSSAPFCPFEMHEKFKNELENLCPSIIQMLGNLFHFFVNYWPLQH